MRTATIHRHTAETQIDLTWTLDGTGSAEVASGIGFLDHMLTLLAKHSGTDLTVRAQGDVHVDDHHLTEDIGIALGLALAEALGDKRGITRYGHMLLPMDETLVLAALDCSGRPFFTWDVAIPQPKVGTWDTELAEDFFRALAVNGGLTLHLRLLAGTNSHHILEGLFKGFARALRTAIALDPRESGIPSTKGTL
jgi:imidazoleglycerol-phosphate dehydratase